MAHQVGDRDAYLAIPTELVPVHVYGIGVPRQTPVNQKGDDQDLQVFPGGKYGLDRSARIRNRRRAIRLARGFAAKVHHDLFPQHYAELNIQLQSVGKVLNERILDLYRKVLNFIARHKDLVGVRHTYFSTPPKFSRCYYYIYTGIKICVRAPAVLAHHDTAGWKGRVCGFRVKTRHPMSGGNNFSGFSCFSHGWIL